MELLTAWEDDYCIVGCIQMNNYPIWWDSDITLYNKYTDPQTQITNWHRTVLNNCFWKPAGNKIAIGNTVIETDDIICRIPESPDFRNKSDWANTPNDLMSNYFTLSVGDIIVFGEVSDTINEYASGQRSTDLIAKYKDSQGCMEIQKVALNVGMGRCNPHYFIRGL